MLINDLGPMICPVPQNSSSSCKPKIHALDAGQNVDSSSRALSGFGQDTSRSQGDDFPVFANENEGPKNLDSDDTRPHSLDETEPDVSSCSPIHGRWAAEVGAPSNVGRKPLMGVSERNPNEGKEPVYRVLPIFSGVVVSFSILLAIPSLTTHWYIRTNEEHAIVETKPNSVLLNTAMVISMVCAVLSSACLVVRFAERGVKPMTLLCIIFLTIHDIISGVTVTVFGIEHRFDDGFTYGQAFWMTVCATLASTITNITLTVDYVCTPNFATSGSGLTHKQRSLVVYVIILLFYIALGSLVQAFMLKLSFIDSLYLTVVSIETIGFGDLHPTGTASRIFTMLYIAFGILNLAVAVALSREALLEAISVSLQNRVRAIRQKERKRRVRRRWRDAIKWRLRAKGLPLWVTVTTSPPSRGPGFLKIREIIHRTRRSFGLRHDVNARYTHGPRHRRLNLEALTLAQLEAAAFEAGTALMDLLPVGFTPGRLEDSEGTNWTRRSPAVDFGGSLAPPLTHIRLGGMVSLLGGHALAVSHGLRGHALNELEDDANEYDEDEDEIGASTPSGHGVPMTRTMTMDDATLVTVVEAEERFAFYARLSAAWTFFVAFWMVGSAIFSKTERWSFGNAAYFCFITFTTVGYGDFAPRTAAGRSIFVVWALVGVATMTMLIAILSEAYSVRYKQAIHAEIYQDTMLTSDNPNRRRILSDSQSGFTLAASPTGISSPLASSTIGPNWRYPPGRPRGGTKFGQVNPTEESDGQETPPTITLLARPTPGRLRARRPNAQIPPILHLASAEDLRAQRLKTVASQVRAQTNDLQSLVASAKGKLVDLNLTASWNGALSSPSKSNLPQEEMASLQDSLEKMEASILDIINTLGGSTAALGEIDSSDPVGDAEHHRFQDD